MRRAFESLATSDERHAHGAGDYYPVVVRPRRSTTSFKLATSGVMDETQIHTHMCYSEFGDILEAIAEMDADVISIETSRSKMELLADFARFPYPNEIGPGVYNIHSPRVPMGEEMAELLLRAGMVLPAARLR